MPCALVGRILGAPFWVSEKISRFCAARQERSEQRRREQQALELEQKRLRAIAEENALNLQARETTQYLSDSYEDGLLISAIEGLVVSGKLTGVENWETHIIKKAKDQKGREELNRTAIQLEEVRLRGTQQIVIPVY